MRLSFFPDLRNTGFDPIAQNVAFELGENGKHASERATAGCRQVEASLNETKPTFMDDNSCSVFTRSTSNRPPAVE